MTETAESLFALSRGLHHAAKVGNPFNVEVQGKALLRIDCLEPVVYQHYGRLRRAPHLAGEFALIGFAFNEIAPNLVGSLYGIVQAGKDQHFGVGGVKPGLIKEAGKFVDMSLNIKFPNRT